MNPLLSQLEDIDDLDVVSWWPLAPIWWVVIGLILTVTIYFLIKHFRRKIWHSQAFKILDELEKESVKADKKWVGDFLIASKKIILMHYTRKECASLESDEWLKWLENNDPKGFKWKNKGKILVDNAYSPKEYILDKSDAKELVSALRNWVR
ncbi:DUF4381 domain-containing protein [Rickettsiales bacterium]|nr:DUF4381 domain-containing protein [Rickettsiales bacterium]